MLADGRVPVVLSTSSHKDDKAGKALLVAHNAGRVPAHAAILSLTCNKQTQRCIWP